MEHFATVLVLHMFKKVRRLPSYTVLHDFLVAMHGILAAKGAIFLLAYKSQYKHP